MQVQIKFVSAQADEQTPRLALYALDIRGQIVKVATSGGQKLSLETDDARLGSLIALGPDVADPSALDFKSLITYKTFPQLLIWNANPVQEIPPQFWRPWLPIHVAPAATVDSPMERGFAL